MQSYITAFISTSNILFLKPTAYIQTFLIALLIASTLMFSSLFVYVSLTPFFCYCLSAGIFIVFSGIVILSNGVKSISTLGIISLVVITTWAIYISFFHVAGGLKQTYLLTCFSLFAAASFTFNRPKIIFLIISFFAGIESLYCFLQFLKILPSLNLYFPVTGTWVNPNVTAMFLAMSFPALLYLVFAGNDKWKKFYFPLSVIVIVALVMLKCRTAIIGIVIATLFILQRHYNFMRWFTKKTGALKAISLIIALVLTTLISFYTYNAKKESAEGRQLIWKLSVDMVKQKPITGYGYGSFERNYNLEQSAYFKAGKGTEVEMTNASQVQMAYNEYLENIVEGGIVGLLFFVLFLSILLYGGLKSLSHNDSGTVEFSHALSESVILLPEQSVQKKTPILLSNTIACAGLLAFAGMSLINFTFTAIPVMFLFIVYAAALARSENSFRKFKLKPILKNSLVSFLFYLVVYSSIQMPTLLLLIIR